MAALSFIWLICKLTLLFYVTFVFVAFVMQPLAAVAILQQTMYSWKLMFTVVKQKITIGIMNWKLNRLAGKSSGFTHVIRLRRV